MFRAGRYWVPQWYQATHRIAYWDRVRPSAKAGAYMLGVGAPENWWYDADKAAKARAGEIDCMTAYIARRILLMIPTLLGILFVSFVVVQFAPGGPVERVIAQLSGADTGGTSRISGSSGGDFGARGARSARPAMPSIRSIAARRASIPISSRAWKSSSASTSRRRNASR